MLYYVLVYGFIGNLNAQFVERALEVGVDHTYIDLWMIGGGVAIFDANNDGYQDLFIAGGVNDNSFYINDGSTFEHKIAYLNIDDIDYYDYPTIGIAAADINNDGWDDLFLCTVEDYPNLILLNNKDNTFDVIPSDESGITEMEWSVSASFGDINKDGLLDIFVSNYINSDDYDPINNGEVEGDKTIYTLTKVIYVFKK